MKSLIKKLIPKSVLRVYHQTMAYAADFYYGHPSGQMIVIGVTGTKGKSSTCFLIAKILEEAGYKVGLTSTAMFKIGEREWLNPYKMTMLGRFGLQKFLRQMVKAGCQYAIIETSSEGILQSRHIGIDYDVAVFTNLAPEHIEAHGSFEKYREAKGELFKKIKNVECRMKNIDGKLISKVIIVNGDDDNAGYFLQFSADEKTTYGLENNTNKLQATSYKLQEDGIDFEVGGIQFHTSLVGKFNLYNTLAAITVAQSQGVDLETCKRALEKVLTIPGRMEFIDEGQSFKVIVDYAHNSSSFEALYEAIKQISHNRVIHVFGGIGGGRDKGKRLEMGKIAAGYADIVIVTTDDPYTEDPQEISRQVISGIVDYELRIKEGALFDIIDRKVAIQKAIELAQPDDMILVTGKGCEQKMAIGGKMIPWDDREVVREILKKYSRNTVEIQ